MSGIKDVITGSNNSNFIEGLGTFGLSPESKKIYNLVVGKIIPAIASGFLIVSIIFSFTVNPLFIIGAVAAFVIGFLGVGATYTDGSTVASSLQEIQGVLNPGPPFETNQPVGILNGGNNCWANAALQIILNNQELEDQFATDPAFRNIFARYRLAQRSRQNICGALGAQSRAVLHARNRNIDPGSTMEDPAALFETVLGNIDQTSVTGNSSFYQLQASVNNRPFRSAPEPFIGFPLEVGVTFQNLFNSCFTYTIEGGQRMRKVFPTAPQTLLVHLRRFEYELNTAGVAIGQRKNNNLLDVPFEINLEGHLSLDGRPARFECTGFIQHLGTSVDGGHYIAYVKREGKWWLCNDSTVREATFEEAAQASRNSYMISYGKL